VEITDNDTLTFTLAGAATVNEGADLELTVTMTGATVGASAISLPWSVGATAASGDTEATFADFDDDGDGTANTNTEGLPSGTLMFPAGTVEGQTAASQTITVSTFDDATGEGAEAFAVTLGTPTATALGSTSTSGTPHTVAIAVSDVPSFSISVETNPTLTSRRPKKATASTSMWSPPAPRRPPKWSSPAPSPAAR